MSTGIDPLDCRDLVELVTDYLEGALDPATHARVEHHLGRCAGCAHYLEQMRATTRSLRSLRAEDLDPRLRERLLAAFREWP